MATLNDVINTMENISDYKELFNFSALKIKTDTDFEKYLKKKSQDLLKMASKGAEINKHDFCLLLKQKLTNALGSNKAYILSKNNNLLKKYNTFPSQYNSNELSENNYYNTYKQLKKEIEQAKAKIKKENTKNKIIKLSIQTLAKMNAARLKEMVLHKKLTASNFKAVLKHKLENKYLGKKAADI